MSLSLSVSLKLVFKNSLKYKCVVLCSRIIFYFTWRGRIHHTGNQDSRPAKGVLEASWVGICVILRGKILKWPLPPIGILLM